MTTETDFLTRDIPGPKPYGRAVFAVAPMIDWTDRCNFLRDNNVMCDSVCTKYQLSFD